MMKCDMEFNPKQKKLEQCDDNLALTSKYVSQVLKEALEGANQQIFSRNPLTSPTSGEKSNLALLECSNIYPVFDKETGNETEIVFRMCIASLL